LLAIKSTDVIGRPISETCNLERPVMMLSQTMLERTDLDRSSAATTGSTPLLKSATRFDWLHSFGFTSHASNSGAVPAIGRKPYKR
jgi:hypothetical protein